MPSLSNLMEDYRNWRGRQEWEQGKGWQDFFGGDPRAQEQFEKLSGFGTDAGGLVGMIKASHGSPHAFTKFDFSKIGTGEGAQAYGHGGYFAQGFDSPVAQQYREALSGGAKKAVNTSFSEDPELWAAGQLHSGIKPEDIADGLSILGYKGNADNLIKAAENRLKNELDAGHLYNVELRWPDPAREAADPLGEHHLLDWDVPNSQQSEQVIEAIKSNPILQKRAEQMFSGMSKGLSPLGAERMQAATGGVSGILGKTSGREAYQAIMNELEGNPDLASKYLRDLGIPGIRYLDQASRGAGEGTRNYVMFDDALANIVSRNGVSLSDLLRR